MQNSARFYALPQAQVWYRDAIRTVINRRNGINGVAYVDDPTVMSWQLANEPRPGSDRDGRPNFPAYMKWIDETAGYIHGLAPRQLVSTGSEGAMGSLRDIELYVQAHESPNVDYLTFHLWPSNWSWIDQQDPAARLESGLKTSLAYIDRHIDAAGQHGQADRAVESSASTAMVDLFRAGSGVVARDRFYRPSTTACCSGCRPATPSPGRTSGPGAARGRTSNADWMWKAGDPFTGDPPQEAQGLFSLFDSDASTLGIVSGHARAIRALAPAR